MKKGFWKQYVGHFLMASTLLIGSIWVVSCKDDYYYDDKEPEWLGASIYDYLKESGSFNYYVKLIDDVGYTEVLAKTGSKTLFVADDAAFEKFFQNNSWGVAAYDKLSVAQKKLILNYGMIDNAYLLETLANYYNGTSLVTGTALRRSTAISRYDTIWYENGATLPGNSFWSKFASKGIHLFKDETNWTMSYFLQKPLQANGITDSDFELITGTTRTSNDAHILSNKVVVKDITCKNGYVDVLENVLVPPVNIAEHLRQNSKTTIFSRLLERFSAPYYSNDYTVAYKVLNPEFQDSLFVKYYFAEYGGKLYYPDQTSIPNDLLLPFNPGWNSYVREISGSALQSDMAAMLAPTDEAMNEYFQSGEGTILKDQYGTWDNVPDDKVIPLLRRHMRTSFLNTLPSNFSKMNDSENSPLNASPNDIASSYIGINGVVYLTNKVYPPNDYVSVYGPVLFSDNAKVFRWAILHDQILFRLYLNAMESNYSFFVPTDDYFKNYIEPVSLGMAKNGALKFWYNTETNKVNATVYNYDPTTHTIGDSVNVITNETFITNRLLYLLDSHVVVGDVETNENYYQTKGVNFIKVSGNGLNLKVQGGGDIELGNTVNVTRYFEQDNGRTYFIDKPIQTPMQSVYKVLSTTPEFSEFFKLLEGFTSSSSSPIFVRTTLYYGIDRCVKFFNTYNYTVYVPTNEKITAAIAAGELPTWESAYGQVGINEMEAGPEKTAAITKLERFLRYHFQDRSVYVGKPVDGSNHIFQTATINSEGISSHFGTYKNKYFKIGVEQVNDNLVLTTETSQTVHVVKANSLYNLMTCDYIFSTNPSLLSAIDVPGTSYGASTISTSSSAVIHQIDDLLKFE
ncbi:MAG: fasciclin domain-containing protein [Breznakibacter sp.]